MPSSTHPISILIVEDHMVVRRGLRMVLTLQPELAVVGEAGSGEMALQVAAETQPDLILLDLMLPDTNGAALTPQLHQVSPDSKILILSGVENSALIFDVVAAGVDGYTLKEVSPTDLVEAIRQVAGGNGYLHPKITALLSQVQPAIPVDPADAPAYRPALTRREKEVLALMASTATNREIAERLILGEETVRTHVKNILRKLSCTNRTQAVVEAVRMGLIEL